MADDSVTGPLVRTDTGGLFMKAAAGLVLLIVAVALAIVGYRTWTERYQVSTGPNDDVAVSEVVRSTFSGANDLKVAQLTGTVQSVASARSFGFLDSNRVMKAPFQVDYFVDLSRMGPGDFQWNPATKTLTVHPPDVRVGNANVDEGKTYIDHTEGLFVTRGAMAAMQRQASARATRGGGRGGGQARQDDRGTPERPCRSHQIARRPTPGGGVEWRYGDDRLSRRRHALVRAMGSVAGDPRGVGESARAMIPTA